MKLAIIAEVRGPQYPSGLFIVYHGTSSNFLPSIKKHGLLSRGKTNNIGMGGESEKFDAGSVYVGKIDYAMMGAVIAAERVGGQPILLEIDLSNKDTKFYKPDEDFGVDWRNSYDNVGGFTIPFKIGAAYIKYLATGMNPNEDQNEWIFVDKNNNIVGTTTW